MFFKDKKNTVSKDFNDHWSRHTVIYQIYPLSFKDSNDDGRGDLQGIIEKLDYLQKVKTKDRHNHNKDALGVDTIWISPFFRSPMADFGYDIEDYTDIDPVFGDMKTFDRLMVELNRRGMKLIVDFVGNHTAAKHPWFLESKSSHHNPKRDWYIWREPAPGGGPPNNWISVFGGSAWEFDKTTGQYYLHTFLKGQPDLNWYNHEVRKEMMRVIDFWVDKGVSGFRVDALQHFLEDENLRDEEINPEYQKNNQGAYNPYDSYKSLIHRFSLETGKENNLVGEFFTNVLEKHPDLFIVGEIYAGLDDLMKVYEIAPNGRFMPFNFNLIDVKWSALEYKRLIDEYQSKLKPHYLANYVLGNHDLTRMATRLGKTRSEIIAFLQHTLPGVPFIYYGDEIGMTNGVVPPSAIQDILAKMFPGKHPGRDMERTPMQWNSSLKSGFTNGKPWLPVSPNYKEINVEKQQNDERSTLSLYKSLIRLRMGSETLKLGEYVPRHSNSPSVFSFERKYNNERLLVLVNFGENIEREIINSSAGREPQIIFSTNNHSPAHHILRFVELMPHECCVVRL